MIKQQVSWKKQNKQLDDAAQNNVQLKKEINKESDMDSLVQNSINDRIYQLKQEATVLTNKFQSQKYKNLQLQTIIKTIKCRMDEDRKVQANCLTDNNFQNIQSLQRKIKKYQYDLEQINNRTNRTGSVVSDKKHKISLLRTQRVIDSSIFRNIQKQLIGSEMEFKKLLIDKIKHQKIYEQCLNEYGSLKAKAQLYFQNQQTTRKSQSVINQNQDQQGYLVESFSKDNSGKKFKQIQRQPNQSKNTSSDLSKQEQSLYYQFKIKKLLMNLSLNNGKQFVYFFSDIQKINDKYFQTLNRTGDQVTRLQQQIKRLQISIKQNTVQFYKPKAQLSKAHRQFISCQNLKRQIDRNQVQTLAYIKQLNQFMDTQNFTNFGLFLQVQDMLTQNMDLQTLNEFLKQIEQRMSSLNYHQFPREIQESNVIKTGRTDRQKREQKLQDVMNRVKIHQQSDKIMKRQQFKEQYRKMLESGPAIGTHHHLKKKTKKVIL